MSSDANHTCGSAYNIPTICPKCGITLELKERHCQDTGNSHIIACCTSHGFICTVPQPKLHEIQAFRTKVSRMLADDDPQPNEKFLLWMVEHGLKERTIRHKVSGIKTTVHITSAALRAQSAAGYRALKRYREGRAAHAKELSPQYQVEVRTYFPERPAEVKETFIFTPKQVHTFASI